MVSCDVLHKIAGIQQTNDGDDYLLRPLVIYLSKTQAYDLPPGLDTTVS